MTSSGSSAAALVAEMERYYDLRAGVYFSVRSE